MKKHGGQGNKCKRALKEKEIEVSVEIVLKKTEGYVIKTYLYLINVEVSRSISKYLEVSISISTDRLPTVGRHVTDCRPTVGRQIAKTMEKTVGRQLADSPPTVSRQSTNCRPTVGRLLANCRPTVGRLSADCRPTVGRQSVEASCSSQLPHLSVKNT